MASVWLLAWQLGLDSQVFAMLAMQEDVVDTEVTRWDDDDDDDDNALLAFALALNSHWQCLQASASALDDTLHSAASSLLVVG